MNNDGRHDLVSNVCRHRQAIMLKGAGTARRRHHHLPGAPLEPTTAKASTSARRTFPTTPASTCRARTLQKWNGMLFNGKRDVARDLAQMGVAKELDFDGYLLDKVEIVEYDFNWKTFIEVYLEDYHVAPVPSGAGPFRHLRRPASGNSATGTACRPWA